MELRQLRAFCAIAKLKHFTQAAEALGYTQPTVTGQIQALENELGVRLFERLGRKVILTNEGVQFLAYAEKLLRLSDEAVALFHPDNAVKGALRIGVGESLATARLPKLLQDYRQLYPQVEIVLKNGSSQDFKQWLSGNLIDVAFILSEQLDEPGLFASSLRQEETAAVVGPNHLYAIYKSLTPQDLNAQSLILPEPGCNHRAMLQDLLHKNMIRPASVTESNSNALTKQFVKDGWGIAFLPRFAVEQELLDGGLVALSWNGPPFALTLQLCRHKEKWLTPALQYFWRMTVAAFAALEIE